jgi:hypothetical protein
MLSSLAFCLFLYGAAVVSGKLDNESCTNRRGKFRVAGMDRSCHSIQRSRQGQRMACGLVDIQKHCPRACGKCVRNRYKKLVTSGTSPCQDSEKKFDVTSIHWLDQKKGCDWDRARDWKCKFPEFIANCPRTCGTCCDDFSSTERFMITSVNYRKKMKKCSWASIKDMGFRCSIEEVSIHCQGTCGVCNTNSARIP